MNRRFLYIAILILFILPFTQKQAKGQEFPSVLQYQSNLHTINPAFVGIYDMAGFMLTTRKDYTSIQGATLNQQLSYRTPIKNHNSGIGFNLTLRNVYKEKQLFFTFDYSYQLRLDMYNYLRFGLRAGVVNYGNNLSDYNLYPDNISDSQFMNYVRMHFMTVFGLGATIFNDNYYLSLSIPSVINNTFKVNREGYSSMYKYQTAYLAGGYNFKLSNGFLLRPNLLVVGTVGKPVYFDVATTLFLPMNLQIGLNLRSNGSACFSGQFAFPNNIKIGFAADYALIQDIKKYQLGTYEVMVAYEFNLYRKVTRPTYF